MTWAFMSRWNKSGRRQHKTPATQTPCGGHVEAEVVVELEMEESRSRRRGLGSTALRGKRLLRSARAAESTALRGSSDLGAFLSGSAFSQPPGRSGTLPDPTSTSTPPPPGETGCACRPESPVQNGQFLLPPALAPQLLRQNQMGIRAGLGGVE